MGKEILRNQKKDLSHVVAHDIYLDDIELLLAFHPLKSEVDIAEIIKDAKEKGIKVVYSKDDPFCFDGVVLSDIKCRAIMLVPGLFFTKDGKRLGRGKGFYDRSLSVIPPCVRTIGICKKSQILDDLPTEPHDMKVQNVICY